MRAPKLLVLGCLALAGCDAVLGFQDLHLAEGGSFADHAGAPKDGSVTAESGHDARSDAPADNDAASEEDALADSTREDAPADGKPGDAVWAEVGADGDSDGMKVVCPEGGGTCGPECVSCSVAPTGSLCVDGSRCGCLTNSDCVSAGSPRCILATHRCCFVKGEMCTSGAECCSNGCSGLCL